MNPFDSYVLNLMQSIQNPLLTEIMLVITHIVSYAVLAIVFFSILIWRRDKELAGTMFIGLLIEGLTAVSLKYIIMRPRPSGIISEIGYSFPSGHSSRSTLLALIFSHKWGKRIFWYSLAFLVIFSRLYLRVHYATDVIAGVVVGSVVYWVVRRYDLGERTANLIHMKIREVRKKVGI